jgi:hypothetical protein
LIYFSAILTLIANVMIVSPRRHDQIQVAQATIITKLTDKDGIETKNGLNEIGILQRATHN